MELHAVLSGHPCCLVYLVDDANSPTVQLNRRREGSWTSRAAPRPWKRVAKRLRGVSGRGCGIAGLASASRNTVGVVDAVANDCAKGKPGCVLSRESTRAGTSNAGRATTRQGGKFCRVVKGIRTKGKCGRAQIAACHGGYASQAWARRLHPRPSSAYLHPFPSRSTRWLGRPNGWHRIRCQVRSRAT